MAERAKRCELCRLWHKEPRSFNANHIIGECTKDADNNHTTEGIRLSLIGYKFTTHSYGCDGFRFPPVTPCSIGSCTKLVELEVKYRRHIQQHNGETVT